MYRYIRMRDMPKEILRTMGKRLKMLREETDMDQHRVIKALASPHPSRPSEAGFLLPDCLSISQTAC